MKSHSIQEREVERILAKKMNKSDVLYVRAIVMLT